MDYGPNDERRCRGEEDGCRHDARRYVTLPPPSPSPAAAAPVGRPPPSPRAAGCRHDYAAGGTSRRRPPEDDGGRRPVFRPPDGRTTPRSPGRRFPPPLPPADVAAFRPPDARPDGRGTRSSPAARSPPPPTPDDAAVDSSAAGNDQLAVVELPNRGCAVQAADDVGYLFGCGTRPEDEVVHVYRMDPPRAARAPTKDGETDRARVRASSAPRPSSGDCDVATRRDPPPSATTGCGERRNRRDPPADRASRGGGGHDPSRHGRGGRIDGDCVENDDRGMAETCAYGGGGHQTNLDEALLQIERDYQAMAAGRDRGNTVAGLDAAHTRANMHAHDRLVPPSPWDRPLGRSLLALGGKDAYDAVDDAYANASCASISGLMDLILPGGGNDVGSRTDRARVRASSAPRPSSADVVPREAVSDDVSNDVRRGSITASSSRGAVDRDDDGPSGSVDGTAAGESVAELRGRLEEIRAREETRRRAPAPQSVSQRSPPPSRTSPRGEEGSAHEFGNHGAAKESATKTGSSEDGRESLVKALREELEQRRRDVAAMNDDHSRRRRGNIAGAFSAPSSPPPYDPRTPTARVMSPSMPSTAPATTSAYPRMSSMGTSDGALGGDNVSWPRQRPSGERVIDIRSDVQHAAMRSAQDGQQQQQQWTPPRAPIKSPLTAPGATETTTHAHPQTSSMNTNNDATNGGNMVWPRMQPSGENANDSRADERHGAVHAMQNDRSPWQQRHWTEPREPYASQSNTHGVEPTLNSSILGGGQRHFVNGGTNNINTMRYDAVNDGVRDGAMDAPRSAWKAMQNRQSPRNQRRWTARDSEIADIDIGNVAKDVGSIQSDWMPSRGRTPAFGGIDIGNVADDAKSIPSGWMPSRGRTPAFGGIDIGIVADDAKSIPSGWMPSRGRTPAFGGSVDNAGPGVRRVEREFVERARAKATSPGQRRTSPSSPFQRTASPPRLNAWDRPQSQDRVSSPPRSRDDTHYSTLPRRTASPPWLNAWDHPRSQDKASSPPRPQDDTHYSSFPRRTASPPRLNAWDHPRSQDKVSSRDHPRSQREASSQPRPWGDTHPDTPSRVGQNDEELTRSDRIIEDLRVRNELIRRDIARRKQAPRAGDGDEGADRRRGRHDGGSERRSPANFEGGANVAAGAWAGPTGRAGPARISRPRTSSLPPNYQRNEVRDSAVGERTMRSGDDARGRPYDGDRWSSTTSTRETKAYF